MGSVDRTGWASRISCSRWSGWSHCPEQAHPLTVRELLDLLVGLHVWEAKHRQDEWVVSGRQLVHNVIVQIQSGEPGFVDGR